MAQLFRSLITNSERYCVRGTDASSKSQWYKYKDLYNHTNKLAATLRNDKNLFSRKSNKNSDYNARICLLVPPSFEYVASTYSVWCNEAISVPLCVSHPFRELNYYVSDCQASGIIAHNSLLDLGHQLAKENSIPLIELESMEPESNNNNNNNNMNNNNSGIIEETIENLDQKMKNLDEIDIRTLASLIIYTSGTTSAPKGVVHTHSGILSNIEALIEAWKWDKSDAILNVLPMHHVHGLVNVTLCPLYCGASVTFEPKFEANKVWNYFETLDYLTLFMAVPTIYAKLIDAFEHMNKNDQIKFSQACEKFRLMVSGSASLPDRKMIEWEKITNHRLLERYGMTEIGMGLSNPYNPPNARIGGTVGQPLKGVECKIRDTDGVLLIKSKSMFVEYFNKAEKTREEFTDDGWFITGDVTNIENINNLEYYKILGRKSADIIKSGGYKISALDIERSILEHESIGEVFVVGIPDPEFEQIIGAIIVLKEKYLKDNPQFEMNQNILKEFLKDRIARYKIPRRVVCVNATDIPKNAMGKVNKKQLVTLFDSVEPPLNKN